MKHVTSLTAVVWLALVATQASAADDPAPELNSAMTDADFVKTAATSDEFERRSGSLAAQRAENASVRELGQMLVTDHTRSTEEITRAATSAGVPVPTPTLHPGFTRKLERLDQVPPDEFDRVFLQQQAETHVDALQLMRTCVEVCEAESLRTVAASISKVVAAHLQHVYELQHEIGEVE